MPLHPWPVRRAPLLALLALTGSFVACNQIFGVKGGVPEGTGGQGGAGATSTSVTSSGTSVSSTSTGATSTSTSVSSSSTGTSVSSSGTSVGSSSTSTSSGGLDGGVLSGCALLLHMDEASWPGPGTVKDSSGEGNNGSPMGNATTTAAGKFGRAGLFDGNSWVVVPNSASIQPTVALTYAAWVYPTGLTDGTPSPGIISKRDGYGVDVGFTMFLWTGNEVWVDLEGTTQLYRFNSNAVLANNHWYHLAVVYDGSQAAPNQRATLYVNGVVDTASAADPTLATSMADIQIGNLPGGGNPFTGEIDDVAIWTRALSAAEIAAIYGAAGPL